MEHEHRSWRVGHNRAVVTSRSSGDCARLNEDCASLVLVYMTVMPPGECWWTVSWRPWILRQVSLTLYWDAPLHSCSIFLMDVLLLPKGESTHCNWCVHVCARGVGRVRVCVSPFHWQKIRLLWSSDFFVRVWLRIAHSWHQIDQ